MKAKTIKAVLNKKFNELLDSIDDNPSIKKTIKENAIISGGCIVSMLQDEQPKDFDIYLKTKQSVIDVSNYYLAKFKENPPERFKNDNKTVDLRLVVNDERVKIVVQSVGIAAEEPTGEYQYFESTNPSNFEAAEYIDEVMSIVEESEKKENKKKYRPIYLTSNAITLSDKIQIIIRFYGEVDEIHKNYDFVHCTNYWDSNTNNLVLRKEALESILTKELIYIGSKYPLCSLFRLRKYLKRNWNITAGQIVKIGYQLSELDLNNVGVLEDQLIGVDYAFFTEIINALRSKDETTVNSAYLFELLDKMF